MSVPECRGAHFLLSERGYFDFAQYKFWGFMGFVGLMLEHIAVETRFRLFLGASLRLVPKTLEVYNFALSHYGASLWLVPNTIEVYNFAF